MRTELVRGEVVIEQLVDDDGKLIRWRRMAFTVPVAVLGGVATSMTFRLDLPGDEAKEVVTEPWNDIVRQMGAIRGERGDGDEN